MRVIRVVAVLAVWVFVVTLAPVAVSTSVDESSGAVPGLAAAEASVQPNFIVIVTDDQRFDTIGRCLPELDPIDFNSGADACMPKLQERLMSQGTTFLRGEVTQSLCCPSRASILTGQYSTNTNVTRNDGSRLDDSSTVATWLQDGGYRTGLVGKYLNGYGEGSLFEYIPPGWDSFHSYHDDGEFRFDPYTDYPWINWDVGDTEPVVTNYNDDDSTSGEACADGNFYSVDLICNLSVDFLQTNTAEPFFLYVAPTAPHIPNQPADRHVGVFDGVILPRHPDHNVIPEPNPPSHLPSDPISAKPEDAFRSQLDPMLAVDDMIGALHDQLVADGRLDDTVWIYISDNGMGHMEHRWSSKGCEYYVCHRVPFVVACPTGICVGTELGGVDGSNYALNIDIAPTIADLASVDPTLAVDGRSLVPILENPESAWRTEWFMYGHRPRYEGVVAVAADGDWYKYVELLKNGELEMYNLDDDPYEIANLAGNGMYAAIEADLNDRLEAFLTGDPALNVPPSALFTSSCAALVCAFTDASTDSDGTVIAWEWDLGTGDMSTAQHPSQTYPAAGTYAVALTVTDNDGDTDTTSSLVAVTDAADATTMHVADLDGSSVSQARGWTAFVHVTVRDADGTPTTGATVTGSWSRGEVSTCTTDTTGVCVIEFDARKGQDTFIVDNVVHPSRTYDATDNVDPDGDSDGTSITVSRP